jgi:hypothetical protein
MTSAMLILAPLAASLQSPAEHPVIGRKPPISRITNEQRIEPQHLERLRRPPTPTELTIATATRNMGRKKNGCP